MKNCILTMTFLLAVTAGFAQDGVNNNDREGITISGNLSVSEPGMLGVSIEWENAFMNHKRNGSSLINISATGLKYKDGPINVDGTGFAIELGRRTYFKKGTYSGFYSQSFLTYSSTSFNEDTPVGKFDGKYSYWSLINGDLGYKINIGKSFSIDPSIGFNWKWEVKGKGDVDNKQFDNFVFRAGIKAGYRF